MSTNDPVKAAKTPASPRKRPQPRKSQRSSAATTRKPTRAAHKSPAAPPARTSESNRRTATVNLPFVTAEFRVPDVHVPMVGLPHPSLGSVPVISRLPLPHVPELAGRQLTDAGRVVGSFLPGRKEVALFAGLGAAAAVGVLEWPVAVAVAAGTEVARRSGRSSRPGPTPAAAKAT
jgi:hypothetical protein